MGIATPQSALAIGFCFPIIGGILVVLRFYARWHQKTARQIDDWLCIPAWAGVTGVCIALLVGVFKDAFEDAPLTDPAHVTAQQRALAQVTAALVFCWFTANALIKLAILFFYRRIFMGKVFNICTWTLIGFSIVWLILAFFSWLFYCGFQFHANFEGGWLVCDPWGFKIQLAVFVFDTFIDFFLLILPIPFVWKLQLTRWRKLMVVVIFCLGGFAFIASLSNTIVQLASLTEPTVLEDAGEGNFFQGSSLLFSNWPAIEVGVGLIACNLPSLGFRAIHSLPKQIKRGWNLSWSGIRHAAAMFSLRSNTQRSHERIEEERTTNSVHDRPKSIQSSTDHSERLESGPSGTLDIPLVEIGSKAGGWKGQPETV